jgi:hypothetical protein
LTARSTLQGTAIQSNILFLQQGQAMISFPDAAAWDASLEAVNFLATTADGALVCSITSEALRHYSAKNSSGGPLDCFAAYRSDVEEQAARMIARGLLEADGSLVICSSDLDRPFNKMARSATDRQSRAWALHGHGHSGP